MYDQKKKQKSSSIDISKRASDKNLRDEHSFEKDSSNLSEKPIMANIVVGEKLQAPEDIGKNKLTKKTIANKLRLLIFMVKYYQSNANLSKQRKAYLAA